MLISFARQLLTNNTLKRRLVAYILPLVMLPTLFVGVVSYLISLQIVMNTATQSTKDLQIQTNQSIDYALKQINDLIDSPLYSDNFMEATRNLMNDHTAYNSRTEQDIYRFLSQVFYANPHIYSILFLTVDGRFFYKSDEQKFTNIRSQDILQTNWAKQLLERGGTIHWDVSEQTAELWNLPSGYIICNRLLRDTLTLEPMGFYIVSLRPKILTSQYDNINFTYDNQLLILSEKGKVVSDSKGRLTGTYLKPDNWNLNLLQNDETSFVTEVEGEKKLIISTTVKTTGWKFVSLISYNQLIKDADQIKRLSIFVVLISLVSILLFSLRFATTIIRPVYQLIDNMRKVKTGHFTPITGVESYTEINTLAENYNLMVWHIEKLLKDVYEAQIARQKVELKAVRSDLKALQSQINPHFIYNTLECINVMAKTRGQQDISQMILSLAKILHINLSKGEEIIPLRNELEMIKEYLHIQQINYQDRFQFFMNVAPHLQDCLIVKFTLQPLFENIIYHGFPDVDYMGIITLEAFEEQNTLTLELTDNGVGMSDDRLEQLNRQLDVIQTDDYSRSIGFGILNVNSRIKLYFGEAFGLCYEKLASGGIKVTVSLRKITTKVEFDDVEAAAD